jgi:hypothetical protein
VIALLLATFLPTSKPAPPPPEIVAKRAPALVEKVDKQQEASPPLERMMGGLPLAAEAAVALKPTFNGGPGAALSVKF